VQPVGGVHVVLQQDRDAFQRAPAAVAQPAQIGGHRVLDGVGVGLDDGVQLRVEGTDAVQVEGGQRDRVEPVRVHGVLQVQHGRPFQVDAEQDGAAGRRVVGGRRVRLGGTGEHEAGREQNGQVPTGSSHSSTSWVT
jgi:hypothetical protein